MITVQDLHFRHPHAQRPILKGVNFTAEHGLLTAILGPNGSGKTTLFKCVAGLWKPQKGDILFEGRSIMHDRHESRAKIIAVVPQEHEPPFPYSVFDAVLMGRTVHVDLFSTPSKNDYRKTSEAIEEVGINHLKERPYTKISGGERQLVLVARALAQDAPVMLLDEPTSHLDFRNQVLVLRKVKKIIKQRRVIAVMTIHDPNLAMLFSDNVVMIKDGSVICQGDAAHVVNEMSLRSVYDIEVVVSRVNGVQVVCPKVYE